MVVVKKPNGDISSYFLFVWDKIKQVGFIRLLFYIKIGLGIKRAISGLFILSEALPLCHTFFCYVIYHNGKICYTHIYTELFL